MTKRILFTALTIMLTGCVTKATPPAPPKTEKATIQEMAINIAYLCAGEAKKQDKTGGPVFIEKFKQCMDLAVAKIEKMHAEKQ